MKNFLDYCAQKYYEGNPIIEDAEFDALAEEYGYESVGHNVKSGVAHMYPMYSLKKCYVGESIIDLGGETVETPKLDGAAVSLLYIGGELKLALTRGDGKRGLDITDKMRYLVPDEVGGSDAVAQINGEVVARKDMPNSRNYASGALGLKDLAEFRNRELVFIAHDIQASDLYFKTYTDAMGWLRQDGFRTVIDSAWEEYPQDGRVIRLNKYTEFEAAGYTASHPKGAYALKERGEGVRTKLVGVDWQIGRSGQISPVALLQPVKVGDATVSRATLHNMKYIEELGLEIGCDVEIIRAGEIIPRVVRRV